MGVAAVCVASEPAEPPVNGKERRPAECAICSELGDENVLFEPCGHKVACEDCSSRMKKCLKCNLTVTKRITQGTYVVHSGGWVLRGERFWMLYET